MKSKLLKYWKFILSGGALILAGSIILSLGFAAFMTNGHLAELFRFLANYHKIRSEYFKNVDVDLLWKGATKGMLDSLGDPYTTLLSDDSFDLFSRTTSGEYAGIGVLVGLDKDSNIRIFSVFPDSSAAQAGLQAGDIILSVDMTSAGDLGLAGVSHTLRGQIGTTAVLAVRRGEENLDISVTRANITLPTVVSRMVDSEIGYIHIFNFSNHTPDDFRKQLTALKEKGCRKLIVDVRMNPGGVIDSVVSVADQLISAGTVVSYHTKSGDSKVYTIDGAEEIIPLIILIDKNSASASEILAGAIQDRKEGIVMGETSYGKGTVQAVYQESDRTAIKISIAEYKTPSGKSIDKKGIQPDIEVKQEGRAFDFTSDTVLSNAIEYFRNQ